MGERSGAPHDAAYNNPTHRPSELARKNAARWVVHGQQNVSKGVDSEIRSLIASRFQTEIWPKLCALVPSVELEKYASIVKDSDDSGAFGRVHLKMLIYAVINNFAGISGLRIEDTFQYLRSQEAQVSRELSTVGLTLTKTVFEKLLIGAVEAGDSRMVDRLLGERSAALDVNNIFSVVEAERFTLVERSSKLRDLTVTQVLIRHGADVNKTHQNVFGSEHGALERAIGRYGASDRVDPSLIMMLLAAGAYISSDILLTVISSSDTEVSVLLIRHGARTSRDLWTRCGVFRNAISLLDPSAAMEVATLMVDMAADLDFRALSSGSETSPLTVIDAAAQRGNLAVMQKFIEGGARITKDTLTFAIRGENMEAVRFVISKGADLDSLSCLNTTPLAEAIRKGESELVSWLQQHGASDRIDEKWRYSAILDAAAEVGNAHIVQSMIDRTMIDDPLLVELHQNHEWQQSEVLGGSLLVAVCHGQAHIAYMLLEAGANANLLKRGIGAGLPLLEALKGRDANLVRALLNADADVAYDEFTFYKEMESPIELAVRWGDTSLVRDLLFAGANVNQFATSLQESTAPLTLAIKEGNAAMVEFLLEAGADVNNAHARLMGCTALSAAVEMNHTCIVRKLLAVGADPDDSAALLHAAKHNQDILGLILEKFRQRYPLGKNGFGISTLEFAIEHGNKSLVQLLLESKVHVRSLGEDGNLDTTPLGTAIMCGHADKKLQADIVTLLIEAGANVNDIVSHGQPSSFFRMLPPRQTALLEAIHTGDCALVQLVLDHKADVNCPATLGIKRTPLQKAAEDGNLRIVEMLLDHGADVNGLPAKRGGATALQLAAMGGFIGLAERLIAYDADVNGPVAKLHGRSAVEAAAEHGRVGMVQLLLKKGAVA